MTAELVSHRNVPKLDNLPRSVELVRAPDGSAELVLLDQRKLPQSVEFIRTGSWKRVIGAIKSLEVRGAPAIGVAGAAAVALWACNEGVSAASASGCATCRSRFLEGLQSVCDQVSRARPTAVNLMWAVRRINRVAREFLADAPVSNDAPDASSAPLGCLADALFCEIKHMEKEDEALNRAIGCAGAHALPASPARLRILTHCNAGSLATVFYGTALGVVYAAAGEGRVARVYADETRPVGQGARLTAWELSRAGVPVTLICDNMAASLMAQGQVDAVVVGADRIAANGDTANKIGTYGVAVLAKYHGIPFFVAAPTSTIDETCKTGADIPIEQRDTSEVLACAIEGVEVWNPAFDVTPAGLIDGIITEHGVFNPADVLEALRP